MYNVGSAFTGQIHVCFILQQYNQFWADNYSPTYMHMYMHMSIIVAQPGRAFVFMTKAQNMTKCLIFAIEFNELRSYARILAEETP